MFRRGRRLFSIASILLILTAVAHTLGALIALYWYYRIPPPLISFVIVEIVFLLAILIPNRKPV